MEFVWRTISFSLTGIKRQGQELLVNFPFGWGLLAGPAVSLCFSHQSFTVATPCPPQPFCCFQFLKITKPYFCLSHAFEFFIWQGLALWAPAQWKELENMGRPRQEWAWVKEEHSVYLCRDRREGSMAHGILTAIQKQAVEGRKWEMWSCSEFPKWSRMERGGKNRKWMWKGCWFPACSRFSLQKQLS